jgi:hypothetical protein
MPATHARLARRENCDISLMNLVLIICVLIIGVRVMYPAINSSENCISVAD